MAEKDGSVTEAEIAESFVTPTVTVNRFLVTTHETGMRLAFGEAAFAQSPTNYRASVFMTFDQVEELQQLLERLLTPLRAGTSATEVSPNGNEN